MPENDHTIQIVRKFPATYVSPSDKPGAQLAIPDDKNKDGIYDPGEVIRKPGKVVFEADKGGFFDKTATVIMQTLAGENTAGKIIARGEDVAAYFIPGGEIINDAADGIGQLLKSKIQSTTEESTMTNTTTKNEGKAAKVINHIKEMYQQPTSRTAALTIITLIVGWFGLHVNPHQLANSIPGILTAVAGVAAGVHALWVMVHQPEKKAAAQQQKMNFVPSMNNTLSEIHTYMQDLSIPFKADQTKKELLTKIKQAK